VGLGQETPARHGVDGPVEAGLLQRQDDVDGGEAGADEHDRPTTGKAGDGVALPGVPHRTGRRRAGCRRRPAGRVPQRQHDLGGPQRLASLGGSRRLCRGDTPRSPSGQAKAGSSRARGDTGDPALDGGEGSAAPGGGDFVVEARLEVLAVQPARQKGSGVGLRLPGPGPVEEVGRLVGKGAHPGGRDVEQVGVAGRAVGHTPAQPGSLLHEHDADGRPAAEKVQGGEHPAGPAADDGDGGALEPQAGERQGGKVVEEHGSRTPVAGGEQGPQRPAVLYTPVGVYKHSYGSASPFSSSVELNPTRRNSRFREDPAIGLC